MIRTKIAAPIVGVALAATALSPVMRAYAAEPAAKPAQTQTQQMQAEPAPKGQQTAQQGSEQNDFLPFKISRNAAFGLREVQMAQAALKAGDTAAAKKLVTDAKARFEQANADAITMDDMPAQDGFGPNTRSSDLGNGAYFPVGAQMVVNEDFSAAPHKAEAMTKAQEHAKKGDTKSARETLKLAEIDLAVVVALLPQDGTMKAIDAAVTAIDAGKADEAGKSLAAIQQGLIVEGAGLSATPKASGALTTGSVAQPSAKPANANETPKQ